MIKKRYIIQIWFLDDNLNLSACYMTNKILERTIKGCIQVLINSVFYFNNIKNKKFYNYFFKKPNLDNSMINMFFNWPLKKKPDFICFNSRESKWCRQCREHFEYIKKYLEILFLEYEFRFGKQHKDFKFLNWIKYDCKINLEFANLKQILIPWKNINPYFRRKHIIDGYRLQYLKKFEPNSIFEEYHSTKRDIPDFVLKFFKLDLDH